MGTDVYDRPGHIVSDTPPDMPPEDGLEESYGAPDATGADMPPNHPDNPDRKKSMDDEEILAAETEGNQESNDPANDSEEGGLLREEGDGKKSKRRGISRKQATVGTGGALLIALSLQLGMVLQGPLQLVHFSQLLQKFHFSNDESFSDSRVGKLYKYMRTRDNPERRNLSHFGNKMADHYDAKLKLSGIEPEYNNRGTIVGLNIDPENEKGRAATAALREAGVDVPEGPVAEGGRVRVDLEGTSGSTRRRAIRVTTAEAGMSKISTAVASRLGIKRGNVGMFHPIQAANRKAEDSINAYIKKILEKHDEARRKGPDDQKLQLSGDDADPDGDGEGKPATDAEGADAGRQASELSDSASEGGKLAGDAAEEAAATTEKEMTSKLKGGKTAGALAVVGLICGLKKLGDQIPDLKYAKMVVPLMRVGMEMVSVGSQIQSGQDVSIDEIGVLAGQLYSEEDGTSAFSAASIQAQLGEPITGTDMPEADKPNVGKPGFFKVLDGFIGMVPGGNSVCDFVTNTVGSWVMNIAGTALTSTTPVGFFIGMLSGTLTGYVSGKVLAPFMKSLVGWLSGRVLDTYGVAGSLLGSYADYGTRLASNDLCIATGCTELSSAQSAALRQDTNTGIRQELKGKSFYARYFDPLEPDSLMAKVAFENTSIRQHSTNLAFLLNPIKNVSSLLSGMMPGASAEETYDYGFPEFGFTVEEMDSPRYDDPYENADRVEPKLAEMNEKYGEPCFGTTINPDTGRIEPGSDVKHYDELPEMCRDRSNQELTDFRFYMSDVKAAHATMCYAGVDDDACAEMGFNSSAPGTGGGTPATPTDIGNKRQDTSGMACAALGLTSEHVVPVGDGTISIKLCDYGEVRGVNASWSNNMSQLIDTAKSAGVNLAGGGFRTAEQQIALRTTNGCPDIYTAPANSCRVPTAIPGTSNHELGLAIDYSTITSQCFGGGVSTCVGNQSYDWLTNNASKWKVTKLRTEAWHWSVDGR